MMLEDSGLPGDVINVFIVGANVRGKVAVEETIAVPPCSQQKKPFLAAGPSECFECKRVIPCTIHPQLKCITLRSSVFGCRMLTNVL